MSRPEALIHWWQRFHIKHAYNFPTEKILHNIEAICIALFSTIIKLSWPTTAKSTWSLHLYHWQLYQERNRCRGMTHRALIKYLYQTKGETTICGLWGKRTNTGQSLQMGTAGNWAMGRGGYAEKKKTAVFTFFFFMLSEEAASSKSQTCFMSLPVVTYKAAFSLRSISSFICSEILTLNCMVSDRGFL